MLQAPTEPLVSGPTDPARGFHDPIRDRLGPLARLLPRTYGPLDPRLVWQVLKRLAFARSLYYSARFRGRFLIARGTKVVTQRSSRIEFAPGSCLLVGFLHHGPNRALVNLGREATIVVKGTAQFWRGTQVMVFKGGRLELGDQVILNEGARVICYDSIKFGPLSGMSWDTTVIDSDLHAFSVNGRELPLTAPVELEHRVFLCAGATVLKGVRVGTGSIVAAQALVAKDVPPGCIVGGNPAKVIHEGVEWQ